MTDQQPNEDELRAAYEAELNRITTPEMIFQTAVSLLNLGGRRLGLAGGPEGERDLEQVRDAIDGVRGLMAVLERRMPKEIGPLRDALAQLQMAFAREAQGARETSPPTTSQVPTAEKSATAEKPGETPAEEKSEGPGPAQASGRLWVPGR